MHREMNFIHQQNGGNWDHQLMTQSAYNEIQTGFNDIVLIKVNLFINWWRPKVKLKKN